MGIIFFNRLPKGCAVGVLKPQKDDDEYGENRCTHQAPTQDALNFAIFDCSADDCAGEQRNYLNNQSNPKPNCHEEREDYAPTVSCQYKEIANQPNISTVDDELQP